MFTPQAVPRSLSRVSRGQHAKILRSVQQRQFRTGRDKVQAIAATAESTSSRRTAIAAAAAVGVIGLYTVARSNVVHAEEVPIHAEIKFEPERKKSALREENRDIISSQHLQVKKSWENPGVYAWGSNSGRVVAPDSDEINIKTPRRMTFFDNQLLRDIKLDKTFGAAVNEKGDLLQWGTFYDKDCRAPVVTLRGKDITKISISRDRIIALSSSGTVYSIPAALADQNIGIKPEENTWIPFLTSKSPISYRKLTPENLHRGEKVTDISSGLEHCLILTSKGRVFSAASGTEDFPSKGQLGIPGLTWATKPAGPYDQPHEISTLKGFEIVKIATGDNHSLVLDKEGRVFSFGDNALGQLGFEFSPESPNIDAPSLLPINKLYSGTNLLPRVTNVAAGGVNSFFTIDATRVAGQGEEPSPGRSLGRVTADTWACGQGIWGGLGNGRWTHVQGMPTKIKALSGLFEYDERSNTVVPIRLSRLNIGATHASAVMDNVTYVGATEKSSHNDTNWGADTLFWGSNQDYQLGTGRRNNLNVPTYIAPMDAEADKEKGRREEHRFQITPRKTIKLDGRNVSVEQRIECGRGCTAVYSGT